MISLGRNRLWRLVRTSRSWRTWSNIENDNLSSSEDDSSEGNELEVQPCEELKDDADDEGIELGGGSQEGKDMMTDRLARTSVKGRKVQPHR